MNNSSGFFLLVIISQDRSCSKDMMPKEACLINCGSLKMNAHVYCLSNSLSTSRAKHFNSAKSSLVFPGQSHCPINWSNALNKFATYEVIRAHLIYSMSDLCSLVSWQYTVRVPTCNFSSSIHSTLFVSWSLQTNSPFYN